METPKLNSIDLQFLRQNPGQAAEGDGQQVVLLEKRMNIKRAAALVTRVNDTVKRWPEIAR